MCQGGKCACGKPGELCCPQGVGTARCADADGVCIPTGGAERCVKCGLAGGPCCAANRCTDGCCVPTGSTTSICVGSATGCGPQAGPGATCMAGASAGSCGRCGGAGQPCCGATATTFYTQRWCSAPNTSCFETTADPLYPYGGVCVACGGLNQRCCTPMGVRETNPANTAGSGCQAPYTCQSRPAQGGYVCTD